MSQPSLDLCIVNYGLRSPTGVDAAMSIANVLAGICRKMQFRKIEDMKFKPVTLGIAEYLPDTLTNNQRIYRLLEGAFQETVDIFSTFKPTLPSLRLFLGLPRSRPGLASDFRYGLKGLLFRLGINCGLDLEVDYIAEDHDSGLIALTKAASYLQAGLGEFALIGGVESYVSQETVEWLEEQQLLKCSSNRNGFTPGEAAAFCLVSTTQTATRYRLPIKARILKLATEQESCLPGSEFPTAGKGIATAIGSVLQSLPEGEKVAETFCTLKGLRHEAEEFSFSLLKFGPVFMQAGAFTTFVLNWGDIGAASAPALICYAAEKKALGFADPGHHLIFTLSHGGSRSAALIQTT